MFLYLLFQFPFAGEYFSSIKNLSVFIVDPASDLWFANLIFIFQDGIASLPG